MHTYERSSIINLLIIAKILIFGVIVVNIRRAEEKDIPQIEELLYQVHKVHSDKRPDLFIPGSKKYTTNELKEILADDEKPVYVADNDGVILGYAFCVYQRHCTKSSNYTSLYIDDLCVSENSRGLKIGTRLYEYVLDVAKENGCEILSLRESFLALGDMKAYYSKDGMHPNEAGYALIRGDFEKYFASAAGII